MKRIYHLLVLALIPSPVFAINAFVATTDNTTLVCKDPPTQNDVNTGQWLFTDRVFTLSAALEAGIPVASGSGSVNRLIIVKDYMRAKSCVATDGKTEILYGQVIRTVVEASDFDAKAGVNLAALAAKGTLEGTAQNLYVYKDGFFNSKIDAIIGQISGKQFNVDTYADFQQANADLIKLLSESDTQFSPNKLLVLDSGKDEITHAPYRTWALFRLSKGDTCVEAQRKYTGNNEAQVVVQSVYESIAKNCSNAGPNSDQKAEAKAVLKPITNVR